MGCRSRAVSANKSKRSSSWIMAAVVWSPRRINRVCSARSRCSCCILYLLAARIIKNRVRETWHIPVDMNMEWVQFLIQWPQQPMREPMLLLRTQWFGRVSTLHIYISHIEIRVKFRGGTKGVEELHTDELPHPPTLGTKQRWAKHHYQFTKNNQKTQTKSRQSTLLFTSSHSFFWWLWNDDHILQKGRQQQHSLTILFQTDRHKQKSLQTRQGLPHKANSNHQGHAATQQGSKPPTCFHFIFFFWLRFA